MLSCVLGQRVPVTVCYHGVHSLCTARTNVLTTQSTNSSIKSRQVKNVQNYFLANYRTFTTSSNIWAKRKESVASSEMEEGGEQEIKKNKKKRKIKASEVFKKMEGKRTAQKVDLWNGMTIEQIGSACNCSTDKIVETLKSLRVFGRRNTVDVKLEIHNTDVLLSIASRLGFNMRSVSNPNKSAAANQFDRDVYRRDSPPPEDLVPRAPVVTIMGHIDHGKTSLLDYLRKSRIVAGEHGGITQHIGAFTVNLESGDAVTFIDTPGHAAFTNMRARGANITDIVILIVDSCEGVLDQTKESLRMIRQARVPFIVALNKIDKKGSNIDLVKKQLNEEGVVLEDDGGDVQCVPISALKGTNVSTLVEEILALAEILELKCDKTGLAEGNVIESQNERGLGKTATVLISRGSLKPSQFIVGDKSWCKVRMLIDDRGKQLKVLKPSQAAKVVGWREEAPSAGSEILGVETEAQAKAVVQFRKKRDLQEISELQIDEIEEKRKKDRQAYEDFKQLKRQFGRLRPRYNDDWNPRPKESEALSDHPKVSIIVKGDVDGSVEALLSCLETYSCPDVDLDIVSFGVGEVTDSDLVMAEKFDAVIYAFNTTVPADVRKAADAKSVSVRNFNVIYHLIADLKNELSDKMSQVEVEDILGRGTVLQEFIVTVDRKKVPVAGTRVLSGKISKDTKVRLERHGQVIFDGDLSMLKHLKDEVEEVRSGQECGLCLADPDVRVETGDQILCYQTHMESRRTPWDPGF